MGHFTLHKLLVVFLFPVLVPLVDLPTLLLGAAFCVVVASALGLERCIWPRILFSRKISVAERSSGLLALALCFVVTLPPFSSGFPRFSSGNQ